MAARESSGSAAARPATERAAQRRPSPDELSPDEKRPSSSDPPSALLVHGSAVRFAERGVLVIGQPGRGKSDLALRLIDAGGRLIADDQVWLRRDGERLLAEAPEALAGLIELRGIGIMRVPAGAGTLDLVVDLDPPEGEADPLPDAETAAWHGLALPKIRLEAGAASAVARIRLCLVAERVF